MKLFDILSYILSPPKCASCGATLGFDYLDAPLCKKCLDKFDAECNSVCTVCKKKICECICSSVRLKENGCLFHLKLSEYYGGTRERITNRVVYTMKQERATELFAFLADRLALNARTNIDKAQKICFAESVILTYVPRSKRAITEYGHDQAQCLAMALSKSLGIECKRTVKRSWRAWTIMKKLSYKERFDEAESAYLPCLGERALDGCLVLIVDDVVTSGASTLALGKLVMNMGACGFGVISAGTSKLF